MCERFYDESNKYELCIDEAGRGCLFGRVYIGCVVLPKHPASFDGTNIKDSKKFSSKKKLNEVSEYIKEKAFAWHVEFIDAEEIDKINILQSVMKGMHKCIKNVIKKTKELDNTACFSDFTAVIDGNYFNPYTEFDSDKDVINTLKHVTVKQGDAKYMGIASASILAKTSRDAYILEMCDKYPKLDEYYSFKSNVGYGTKKHIEGIHTYGITKWHRKTFGDICRNANIIEIPETI